MPGVHVRTSGQLDWVQQSKELVLAVPGSYWLFHKKNIYKFIFRYHRTTRGTNKFAYGKELMKVIRKIIKCYPRHGQQFATQNLLVAYSHTSWTRQDKMFAMLKFQNRTDAATYSHAFVLTIKLPQKTESKAENPVPILHPLISQCEDPNDAKCKTRNEKEPTESLTDSLDTNVSMTNTCTSRKRELDVERKNEELYNDSTRDNTEETRSKKEKHIRRTSNNVNTCNIDNDSNVSENVQCEDGATPNSKSRENKSYSRDSVRLNKWDERHKIRRRLVFVNGEKNNTKKGSSTVTNEHNTEKTSHCRKSATVQSDANILNDNTNTNSDSTVDSVNLPYQYLIEKEIEDAKNKIPSTCSSDDKKSHVSSSESTSRQTNGNPRPCKRALTENVKEHSPESLNSKRCKLDEKAKEIVTDPVEADTMKVRDSPATKLNKTDRRKVTEKKVISDGKTSRSSDITDLVMEGLMFTIRQGEDSVAVIEQKTKLEVDEVLENSEKVETKEGEKCLRNSSLLGLENLITMLDQPEPPERKHKVNGVVNHGNTLQLNSYSNVFSSKKTNDKSTGESINHTRKANSSIEEREKSKLNDNPSTSRWSALCNDSPIPSTSFTNNFNSSSNGNENVATNKTHLETSSSRERMKFTENAEEEGEEDEDIVPEILQKKMLHFRPNRSTITGSDSRLSDRDLLMDDSVLEQSLNLEKKTDISAKKSTSLDAVSKSNSSHDFRHEDSIGINAGRSDKGEIQERGINVTLTSPSKHSYKHETNVPRVVSNQVITVDQMPLALQKALRGKLRKLSVTPNSKAVENHMNIHEEQSAEKKDTEISKVQLKTVQCDSAENDEYHSDSDTTVKCDNATDSDNVPSTVSENQTENNDMPDNTQKAERVESQVEKYDTPKPRKLATNELQDITQEFYSDLMNLHKKHNCKEQRCRSQRRRSSRSPSDTKNNEIRVEMLKFIQDITRGAKVVVTRMSTKNISSIVGKSSSLTTCLN